MEVYENPSAAAATPVSHDPMQLTSEEGGQVSMVDAMDDA